jgi:O-antigen/teichoic acid export membrane protein
MAPVAIIAALVAAIALVLTFRKASKYRYPPSPPGYNIFKGGHAYLIPFGLAVGPRDCY